jgi:hypothetical protein
VCACVRVWREGDFIHSLLHETVQETESVL